MNVSVQEHRVLNNLFSDVAKFIILILQKKVLFEQMSTEISK